MSDSENINNNPTEQTPPTVKKPWSSANDERNKAPITELEVELPPGITLELINSLVFDNTATKCPHCGGSRNPYHGFNHKNRLTCPYYWRAKVNKARKLLKKCRICKQWKHPSSFANEHKCSICYDGITVQAKKIVKSIKDQDSKSTSIITKFLTASHMTKKGGIVTKFTPWSELHKDKTPAEQFATWCFTFMPQAFYLNFSPMHMEWFNTLLTNKDAKFIMRVAPRGFCKTSIISTAYTLYSILEGIEKFVVIISATGDLASLLSENIKTILETNDDLIARYGDMISDKWSEGLFILNNGAIVMSRGAGQQIRGLNVGGHQRPTLIILDDYDDEETVDNKEIRDKLERKLLKTIIPSLAHDGKLFYIGTFLHNDSVLVRVYKTYPEEIWDKKVYSVWKDDDGITSIWPERWPKEKLEKQKLKVTQGIDGPRIWSQEYLSKPIAIDGLTFPPEKFVAYTSLPDENVLRTVMAVDPSAGKNVNKGDYFAICVLSLDMKERNFYVEHLSCHRQPFHIQAELIHKVAFSYPNLSVIGIESVGYQDVLRQYLDDLNRTSMRLPRLQEIRVKGKKENRIEGIASWIVNGDMQFNPNIITNDIVMNQFLEFKPYRNTSHDDAPDALAMATGMLQGYIKSDAQQPYDLRIHQTFGAKGSSKRRSDGLSRNFGSLSISRQRNYMQDI